MGYGIVLAYTAYQVNRHLRDAQVAVGLLRADLVAKDAPPARVSDLLATVQRESAAARSLTDGPVWGAPALLPWLGRPFVTVRGAASAVDDLAAEVLPDLRAAQHDVLGGKLSPGHGSIDLAPLVAAQQPLAHASVATDRIMSAVRALPETSVGPVDNARATLLSQITDLSGQLRTTRDTVDLLPSMLGAQGTRRYLIAFENNAEARGLGGMPGGYAILRADHGKVTFERFGIDSDFGGMKVPTTGFDEDFLSHYEGSAVGSFFANATVSPHFPYAAELMLRFWQVRAGERLDGVIATDPSALAMLLKVAGPARMADGTVVTADNVVALSERDAYSRFDDQVARKRFLVDLAKAVADHVLSRGPSNPSGMAKALGNAIDERRLLVYSTSAKEQGLLAKYPVAGLLDDTDGLFSGVVINNGGGNKLDYYLARDVTYTSACPGPQPTATVTIKLTNTAPATGLGSYAAGTADPAQAGQPLGTSRLLVGYYATKGASFQEPTLDGKPTFLTADTERGRPVFTATVDIPPGASRTLVIHVDEPPAARGPVKTWVQPLVLPQATNVKAASCGTQTR
ncbi:DUF4012 domain-containing protein [Terrabacter sp. 2YAF2]|uniref:DUF4012 domain-containing protein n=1 Tax=Terrabacter sp. 2YAF2 TaxID=3233026 RepID=UPI003F9DD347